MATAKEILDYKEGFHDKDGNYKSTTFFNETILHASIMMHELFKKAASEPAKVVNMYCGKFSLFRDSARNEINAKKAEYDDSTLTENEKDAWSKLKPFNELQDSLRKFLHDEGTLNLIVEYDYESLKNESVWNILFPEDNDRKCNVCLLYT